MGKKKKGTEKNTEGFILTKLDVELQFFLITFPTTHLSAEPQALGPFLLALMGQNQTWGTKEVKLIFIEQEVYIFFRNS